MEVSLLPWHETCIGCVNQCERVDGLGRASLVTALLIRKASIAACRTLKDDGKIKTTVRTLALKRSSG